MPGLHSPEELEPLLAPLKEQMREDGHHKTTYDFFVSRVQRNLHVALCMVRLVLMFKSPSYRHHLWACITCACHFMKQQSYFSLHLFPRVQGGNRSAPGNKNLCCAGPYEPTICSTMRIQPCTVQSMRLLVVRQMETLHVKARTGVRYFPRRAVTESSA